MSEILLRYKEKEEKINGYSNLRRGSDLRCRSLEDLTEGRDDEELDEDEEDMAASGTYAYAGDVEPWEQGENTDPWDKTPRSRKVPLGVALVLSVCCILGQTVVGPMWWPKATEAIKNVPKIIYELPLFSRSEDREDSGSVVIEGDDYSFEKEETQADDESIHLTDTVVYEGLTPGETYIVTGTLMDKETGKPLMDKNGKEVTGQKTFIPKVSSGSIDMEFIFDASAVDGNRIIGCEELLRKS